MAAHLSITSDPEVNYSQQSGIPTIQPPIIEQVLTEYVPRVNKDGYK